MRWLLTWIVAHPLLVFSVKLIVEVQEELFVALWVRVHLLSHSWVHLALVQIDALDERVRMPVEEPATAARALELITELVRRNLLLANLLGYRFE